MRNWCLYRTSSVFKELSDGVGISGYIGATTQAMRYGMSNGGTVCMVHIARTCAYGLHG